MFRTSFLCAIFLATAFLSQAQDAKLTADEAAIKKVIEEESLYFWGRDFKSWKKCWVQEPYTIWTAASKEVVRQYYGWDSWKSQVESLFKESPEPIPYEGDVKKYDYQFRNYGNGAWVSFKQNNKGTITYETRILEKKGGKWRIAAVHLFFNPNEDVSLSEGNSE